MPPFIPQKRDFSPSTTSNPPTPKPRKRPKPSLFETVDKPDPKHLTSLQDNKSFLDQLGGSDSASPLSDISSDEFEDALPQPKPKRRKTVAKDEDEDEIDWEDAMRNADTPVSHFEPTGDLELTLDADSHPTGPIRGNKKGPSKIERQIRVSTHCMHVQSLLFHNLIRNGWTCNDAIQRILVEQLPANVKKEVEKWRSASGLSDNKATEAVPSGQKRKGRRKAQNERSQRDWGSPAERQEPGAPNMSRGDPLIRLLKVSAAYWRKRWTITAPSLRKQGYKPIKVLQDEITAYEKGSHDQDEHGERIYHLQDFQSHAKSCEGSRDVGAQLFTALLRGLGLEVRLVASLQPVGFGWSKGEEALVKKKQSGKSRDVDANDVVLTATEESGSDDEASGKNETPGAAKRRGAPNQRPTKAKSLKAINVSEESEDFSLQELKSEDDESVIDVTPIMPKKKPIMNYDRDMGFPTYWAEVISPITSEVYPVDPLILTPAVVTNAEQLASFESRGTKADKAKQVFAYVVGYSPDGTAKDVTTRYLKRHMWPGRTKGVRLPVEKVPVYNARGKVKCYEDYDWFKTVISAYGRTARMRSLVDDLEEAKDLKPVKPEKKEAKLGEDTLQGLKSSAEFVLERHLRREEALRPGAKPAKTFILGKGENAKEEPVYRRRDVEVCRTGESWHKEGRAIKAGEIPMKFVPVRAVTLTRKREVEEAERDSGEKPKQGLYSWDQTDWIIPPPIANGVIPKNAFGNMDCYVPTMVPKGAVHIPLRSTVRICKRLDIDYAEAVTGFEFGNKRAVPVITGVVVAEENEHWVIEQWEKEEEERRIKEEGKREKLALGTWRKWLMGLRIIERVREEYGGSADAHMKEEINPFTNQSKSKKCLEAHGDTEPIQTNGALNEDMAGGFFAEDSMEGGGFLPEGDDQNDKSQANAELTIEDTQGPGRAATPTGRPTALGRLAHGTLEKTDRDSGSDDSAAISSITAPRAKPVANGNAAEYSTLKPREENSLTPRKTPKSTTKRRATGSANDPEVNSRNGASRSSNPPKQGPRVGAKRAAARKSETAVKSHYFDHKSDEQMTSDGDDSPSKGYVSEDSPPKRRGRGRPRKSVKP